MKIERKVFLYMFVFGIIYRIHHFLTSLIPRWAISLDLSSSDMMTIIMFLNQVSYAIRWGLLFIVLIVMYYGGKKLDLKANLKSIVISMLVGGFIGCFLVGSVYMPLFFRITQHKIGLDLTVDYLVGNLYTSLETTSFLFFASLTAVAISHLRKNV